MTPAEPYLVVRNLTYTYQTVNSETTSISDVTFSVQKGEFLAIVGPSGCGKSTLLSIIAGLLPVQKGMIHLDGHPINEAKEKIGYMLQKDHLLEWRTTEDNATLGLEIQHKKNSSSYLETERLFKNFGLINFMHEKPSALSGGMRQRAALIRTLVLKPELLLLDEPFSALDYQTRLCVAEDICSIIRGEGKTAILITHDISEAVSIADRVLVMTRRPGHIHKEFIIDLESSGTAPESVVHENAEQGRTEQGRLFTHVRPSPLEARKCEKFPYYFNQIWEALQ